MQPKHTWILLISCLIMPTVSQAHGEPPCWSSDCQPIEAVANRQLPALDVETLLREDALAAAAGAPLRFAVAKPLAITPTTDGTWETLADGSNIWRLRLQARRATSINLAFDRFHLPPGARLDIYATDRHQRIRTFDHLDNGNRRQLWTPALATDDLVVELTLPRHMTVGWELRLASLQQGYRDLDGSTPDKSGSCNVDVVCPEGDPWRNETRSVARITISGLFLCTGFLVNNTAFDRHPFFMTADHCGVDANSDTTLVTYWNYQNSTCRPPGGGSSGGQGDGTLSQFTTGSTFLAGSTASDFTLVELSQAPGQELDVYFAGWDARAIDFASAVGIHHPGGQEKRISFEDDPINTTSYLGSGSPGDGTHLRVSDWDLGTTEGGSSGSPLFSPDHHVVGQLHGGFAACGNDQSDWYGRFSRSWSLGASDWLDPLDTGLMVLDGLTSNVFFADGFESGSTDGWSESQP